ncbi:MAG: hypothetical protein CMH26_03555 [Micavibrio sp.]|nr:hypothetical protein [Micavibrio sp.]
MRNLRVKIGDEITIGDQATLRVIEPPAKYKGELQLEIESKDAVLRGEYRKGILQNPNISKGDLAKKFESSTELRTINFTRLVGQRLYIGDEKNPTIIKRLEQENEWIRIGIAAPKHLKITFKKASEKYTKQLTTPHSPSHADSKFKPPTNEGHS